MIPHSLTIIILGNGKQEPRFLEIRAHIPATLPTAKVAPPATSLKPASPVAKLSQLRAVAKKSRSRQEASPSTGQLSLVKESVEAEGYEKGRGEGREPLRPYFDFKFVVRE